MNGCDFTLGMAAFDNFDEVYFTIQSLRFHHREAIERFEIVVVDNNPSSKDGSAIESFITGRVQDRGRYVPFPEPKGSVPPRAHLFDVAKGKFVVCIDSHVLFEEGSLDRLVKFFDENPTCDDLLHGPLVSNYGPHRIEGTHMVPKWAGHMFGVWGIDPRGNDVDGEPFEIPQHGLGFFAARRESWLRFRDDFSGFSGGEGYIHEKYRQHGRRVLCLPGVRWVHKFARPHGCPHVVRTDDKIRNHIRGWTELGVDLQTGDRVNPLQSICDHFVGGTGAKNSKPTISMDRWRQLCREVGIEYGGGQPKRATSGVIFGPHSFGSYRMCGAPLAEVLGFSEMNSRAKLKFDVKRDVVLAVKTAVPLPVRQKTKRLIWMPLDIWYGSNGSAELEPGAWIRKAQDANRFDDVIVATPALRDVVEKELRQHGVKVHLVPHHADPRVGLDWHRKDGPIVYAGQKEFVGDEGFAVMEQAARSIGREFRTGLGFEVLEGAALCLAPRLLLRTKLNLIGKPTVKVANASQAGIPVLATDDPAITGLFPDVLTAPVEDWRIPERLAALMESALEREASIVRFPFEGYVERMKEIING